MARMIGETVSRNVKIDKGISDFFDKYFLDPRTLKREYGALSDLINRLLLQEMRRLRPVVELLEEAKQDNQPIDGPN